MLRTSSARGRLAVESLECRQLLAGDVSVSVVEGNLYIEGDQEDNFVAITAGEEAGQYVVSGFSDANGVPTSIEGVENGELLVEGVFGNLLVNLADGDDSLILTGVELPRNAVILMGQGDDSILIGQAQDQPVPELTDTDDEPLPLPPIDTGRVNIAGNLVVLAGEGDDRLVQGGVRVGRNELVRMGLGNDQVRFGFEPQLEPNGDDDTVEVSTDEWRGVAVRGNLAVDLGAGDDGFAAHHLAVGGNLFLNGQSGQDRIALVDSTIAHFASINTGRDGDDVLLDGVEARFAIVNTGAGNDSVRITDSVFGVLGVLLGTGDDDLAVGNTQVRWLAFFDGGPGTDTAENLGGNSFGNLIRIRFENEPEPDEP